MSIRRPRSARFGLAAITLSVLFAGSAQAVPHVSVAFSEVRMTLDYFIGIADAEDRRTAFRSAYGDDQAGVTLDGFIAREWPLQPEVRHYQEVVATLVGVGSLAYVDNLIDSPSFYGNVSVTGDIQSIGQHAGGLASAPASENFIYYEFDVAGEPVNFSLSFTDDSDKGTGILQIRSEATGLPIITLGDTEDRMGTLPVGTYYLTASHSISAGDTEPPESSNISVAMTFLDGATFTPYIPEPSSLTLLGGTILLLRGRQRRDVTCS